MDGFTLKSACLFIVNLEGFKVKKGGKGGRMGAFGQCEISSCIDEVGCFLPSFLFGRENSISGKFSEGCHTVHILYIFILILLREEFGNYDCNFSLLKFLRFFLLVENFHQSQGFQPYWCSITIYFPCT